MAAAAIASIVLLGSPASAGFDASYLYDLSDFTGVVHMSGAGLRLDPAHDEVYVFDGQTVRIFNPTGMETYAFGTNPELGGIRDLAVDPSGDIFILSVDVTPGAGANEYAIVRCDYRGTPVERIEPSGLRPPYDGIQPDTFFQEDGRFFLVDRIRMIAAALDRDGRFERGWDLAELIGVRPSDRSKTEIGGFHREPGGRMLFTVPVLFQAFVVSPSGEVDMFGEAGSNPGKFNIAGAITTDPAGRIYVADRLRSCVMVFDRDYEFITEFGYVGSKPGNLVKPTGLAIGPSGRLYVSQLAKRGIAVFAVKPERNFKEEP